MAAHLTVEQFARFQHRTLEAAELLAVDEHLAICGECRDRLGAQLRAFEQVESLQTLLSEHLTYDQTVMAADGYPDAAVREHLAGCATCRDEVDDLRQFQSQLKAAPRNVAAMPVRRSAWRIPAFVGIAAGMLLTVGLTFRMFRTEPQPLQTPQIAQQTPPAEPALAPDQQAAIQLALGTHTFEHAAVLDGLIARRSVLLGAPGEQKSFAINAPLGTVVLTDRPAFRWEMVAGAGSYVVAVFDDRFQKITESPAVTTTEWTPDQPLARGRTYNWQVTAHIGGRTLRSPVPPAPEARFQVAGADSALALENARREHPANHLLLAVLMAKAGALDDASRELDALAASDPANAESLRRSLKAIRGQ